ncbi:adenylate kinase [Arthrobacter sp. CAN_C5]|uniref:adenylate kinase n=1 Tax=Arthrobacter sp. CAN_C5 TaxID=2760706 RepID=UPI001AE44FD5|nr:adenylate kinase [Arthrobacter sp. CAN_C5]MBP2214866.1 adenylate kinase family enzyme [Arthrobacter sp. CAN_C5]
MTTAASPDTPQRVLFYGVTGSGKSTAAHRYAGATGLPEVSADDQIGWLPDWTERHPTDQKDLAAALASSERWVFDTVYATWADQVLPRTQLVVALDYPRWVSLSRLVRRTALRVIRREVVCNGNRETVRRAIARDSILVWHFKSFPRKRARIKRLIDDGGVPVLRFTRPRDLDRWLRSVEAV